MGRKSAPDPADGSDYCTGCLHSALFDHESVCAEQRWRFLECEELDAGRLSKSFSGSEYMERLPEFLFLFHRFYGYFGDGDSADGISHVTE